MNCLKIGVCNGRGYEHNLALLHKYGITVSISDRHLYPTVTLSSPTTLRLNQSHLEPCEITVILGKARDLTEWLASGFIDMAVGYDMHLKSKHEFRILAESANAPATIALVCKEGDQGRLLNTRYVRRVASEFPEKVLRKCRIMFNDLQVTYVTGSAEGLVTNPHLGFDMACTIVQTGNTLKQNHLEVFQTLVTIRPSIFIRRGRWSRPLNYLLYTHFRLPIYIDGIDGSGKTTLAQTLRDMGFQVSDRSLLTKLTLMTQRAWRNVDLDLAIYIVLDCHPEIATKRVLQRDGKLDKWAESHRQYYYNRKYRALASRYGIYLIDTTQLTPEQLVNEVLHNLDTYLMPRIDKLTEEEVDKLEVITEGNSKIIRRLTEKYDLVQYKPTVHSHKRQRAGLVEGTDLARMEMFRNMIEVLWANGIHHTTVYIGDKYLLVEHLKEEEIPNLEIIVKGYFTGTDKYRYYNMDSYSAIFAGDLRGILRYKNPYVRFDWRNPNHHPEDGRPLGDEALSEGLANYFIDVTEAKKLVLKTYTVIGYFLRHYCGIEILDICFMATEDGQRLYYEISPDCARLYKINEEDSVDKDVWRAGGSSELVLQKWKEAGEITERNLLKYLKDKDICD